jgi:hypothetical protein
MLQIAVAAQVCMVLFLGVWAAIALDAGPWNAIAPWSLTGFGISWALLAHGPIFSGIRRKLGVMFYRVLIGMYLTTCIDDYTRKNRLALMICDVYTLGVLTAQAGLAAPALFLLVAFQVEHNVIGLVSALVPLLFMLVDFPTYARSLAWVTTDFQSVMGLSGRPHGPYAD